MKTWPHAAKRKPLPEVPPGSSHHLRYRLSHRDRTLDEHLTHLGISPHPRVVLEGETEEAHIPLVWKALDYPDAPELIRSLRLGVIALPFSGIHPRVPCIKVYQAQRISTARAHRRVPVQTRLPSNPNHRRTQASTYQLLHR